jgi:hypothetical protein
LDFTVKKKLLVYDINSSLLIDNQWHSLRVGGPRVGGEIVEILARLMIPIISRYYSELVIGQLIANLQRNGSTQPSPKVFV